MSLSSDTESDCEESVSCWDPSDFVKISAPIDPSGETHISHLQHAVETLSSITICGIEDDQLALEQVWIASGVIQRFLDFVLGFAPSNEDRRVEIQESLCLFLDSSFLAMLFDFRAVIYDIAARNANGQTLIVCWVDLILAKLGQAVVAVAGSICGIVPSQPDQPSTILAKRDDDMLRAAAQLPGSWSDVVEVLCSEHHSAAAVRLATSLVFGVNVVFPRVTGNLLPCGPDSELRHSLLRTLDKRVKKTIIHDSLAVNEEDRIAYAMFVSLYAVAASANPTTLDLTCRPQSCTALVDMIQAVLRLEPSSSSLSILSPIAVLDTATTILIGWGVTIPWSWTTWMDARLHNSEIIERLSVVWLHTMDVPPEAALWPMDASSEGDDLTNSLTSRPLPALSMMIRLLLCILNATSDTNSKPPCAIGELTVKLCWSVKYLLRTVEVDGPSLLVTYRTMCRLFALLPDGEAELDARDSILESISFFPSTLKGAVNVFSDPKARCCGKLNERLFASTKLLLDQSTCSFMRIARQTAQFLALIWIIGTPQYFNPDAIHGFLASLCHTLKSDTQARRTLGDAAVALLAVIENRRTNDPTFQLGDRCYEIQSICTRGSDPADLLLASSLAAYVCATAGSRSSHLLWADAWSYFCDVLLLILDKEFVESGLEEPLGLFVAPGICRALLSLLEIATDHSLRYCLFSPWTTCLVTRLRKLQLIGNSSSECEDYATILSRRIGLVAELLYNHLEHRSDPAVKTPSPVWESVFCFIRSVPCLILSAS